MNGTDTILSLIGKLTTWKVTRWAVNSDGMDDWEDDRTETPVEQGANVVSSLRAVSPYAGTIFDPLNTWPTPRPHHAILLDLDVPAYLVPSSRPGHSHLYIDVSVPEEDYFNLLDQLARCRVIEYGYASASKQKGGTFLRLPWVKKTEAQLAA
jgi:hypothetical protein